MDPRDDIMAALKEGGIISQNELIATREEIYLAASALNYWRIAVPCAGARSKAALLTKISDALQFPDHFGMNLDALYDCLTDQLMSHAGKGKKGAVLLLEGTDGVPKDALGPVIDTLLDAAEFVQMKGSRLTLLRFA